MTSPAEKSSRSHETATVIIFPPAYRTGHLRRAARQLAVARSEREASFFVRRTVEAFENHLLKANVEADARRRHTVVFVHALRGHCVAIGCKWMPELGDGAGGAPDGGGNAA